MASLLLFGATAWILHHELQNYHYKDVIAYLKGLPGYQVGLSALLTIASYLVLTGYDVLALRYIARKLDYGRTAITSFVGYVFSHNLTLLGGSAARYRIYSAWGISAWETATIVLFCGLSYWLGFLGLGALIFLLDPIPIPPKLPLPFVTTQPLGWVFLGLTALYLLGCALRRRPIRIRGWVFHVPSFQIAFIQVAISVIDWVLGGAVVWALLPENPDAGLVLVLQVFLLAQFAGMVSHVPGGLGVFETVLVLSLDSHFPAPVILGSLVAYRGIYYLLPLALAALVLGIHEALQRREHVRRAIEAFGKWLPAMAPRVLALTSFVGGVLLLFSNATPTPPGRDAFVREYIPLSLVETSHFLGSVIGVGLLLMARGLQRRLEVAYRLTAVLLAAGILVSIVKSLDYEEAFYLTVMLAALLPCRAHFYRKASLMSPMFNAGWVIAVALVLGCSVWLGYFAFKHQSFSSELWWHFSLQGDASRYLRASVAATVSLLAFAMWKVMHHVPYGVRQLPRNDLDAARPIVEASPRSNAKVALLGESQLLFNDARTAFLPFVVRDRSWIALSDPIGPEDQTAELAWRFHERCERRGAWTVFHQVRGRYLPVYLDLGLTLLPLGEEARVSLQGFSFDSEPREEILEGLRRVEQSGGIFELWEAPAGDPVPRQWAHFPVAVARNPDRILAYGALWSGAEHEEASLNRIRVLQDAPEGILEFLFLKTLLWSQRQGYRYFNLGTAPLANMDGDDSNSLWARVGVSTFSHGEFFQDFAALRRFKANFNPQWETVHLACPGGLALPRILTQLTDWLTGT